MCVSLVNGTGKMLQTQDKMKIMYSHTQGATKSQLWSYAVVAVGVTQEQIHQVLLWKSSSSTVSQGLQGAVFSTVAPCFFTPVVTRIVLFLADHPSRVDEATRPQHS